MVKEKNNRERGICLPRVMLINPPQKYFSNSLGFNSYFPIGLLSLAAMVRDICDVRIFDCLIQDFATRESGGFIIYGTLDGDIKNAVREYNPDIVGICIPFSAQSKGGITVARLCREVDEEITVVMGGPHPSVRYSDLLKNRHCDYAVVGEGEETFREFVLEATKIMNDGPKEPESKDQGKTRLSGAKINIQGAAFLKEEEVQYIPRPVIDNLDDIPFPAYDLIDVKAYLNSPYLYKSRRAIGQQSISMITSRGCPYKCVFCSIAQHMGTKYRYHSPDYTIDHIKHVTENLGIRNFHFEDDNLTLHRRHFRRILKKIIDDNLNITWDTPNGIRADSLSRDTVRMMKEAGAQVLQIAIESGNERVLNEVIKKDSKLKPYHDVAKWCNEFDITLGAFYVIGFPGETQEDMKDTTDLALYLFTTYNVFPILLFATPLFGTELYLTSVEHGLIEDVLDDDDFATATQFYGDPLINTGEFSPSDLKRIAKEFEREMDKVANKQGALRKVLSDKTSLLTKDRKLTSRKVA